MKAKNGTIKAVKETLQREKISVGVYLTAIGGWITFLFTVWHQITPNHQTTALFMVIFNFLTLLGIKRNQVGTVAKIFLRKVADSVRMAKMCEGTPQDILVKIEAGLSWLLDNWHDTWKLWKEMNDGSAPDA